MISIDTITRLKRMCAEIGSVLDESSNSFMLETIIKVKKICADIDLELNAQERNYSDSVQKETIGSVPGNADRNTIIVKDLRSSVIILNKKLDYYSKQLDSLNNGNNQYSD